MTFHCTKLRSGDCCAPLMFALHVLDQHPYDNVLIVADHMGADFGVAVRDANDPAKLAEFMAIGLRSRGFDAACDWSDRHDFYIAWWPNDLQYGDGTQLIHVRAGRYGRFDGLSTDEWTMPQARTKLLAIMATQPDESSREACEAILRSET